jgi:integrase
LPLHLKPKTVYNIIGILSKILNDVKRRRDIHRLPEFPRIEVADPETCWIGKQEQRRVLEQVKNPLKRVLYLLMMETGARALKWSRVQFGADIIVIAAAMDEDVYKERTKETDVRFLPMEPQVKQALLALAKQRLGEFVFAGKDGGPLKAEAVRRTWREAAKKVGVDVNCYQGTRHSFASQALNSGVPLEIIGQMLGYKPVVSFKEGF